MKILIAIAFCVIMTSCASKVIVNYSDCEQRGTIDEKQIAKCPVFELK